MTVCSFSPAQYFIRLRGAVCPLRLKRPGGSHRNGVVDTCNFFFRIRLLFHAVPGGLTAPQQEQAYRRITTQKLLLPLFSLLSLHIKPPWCHRFITMTKRQASSCPSSLIKQSLYQLGSFFSIGLRHIFEPSDSSQQRVGISRCSCQPVTRSL